MKPFSLLTLTTSRQRLLNNSITKFNKSRNYKLEFSSVIQLYTPKYAGVVNTISRPFSLSARELLDVKLERVMQGGSPTAVQKHRSRGKMLPRERIDRLVDPGTPFIEIGALAGDELYDGIDLPSGGIVAGIGVIHGVKCMIAANDATVKGGTYFPISVKKHLRAQEIAENNYLPCIYLVDSGGAYLPMQSEVFPDRDHFGRIFYNQANMSAKGIPQISAVLGSCTAGGAYVPAMSDETVIVEGSGTIFLAGPPLVQAATGEKVTAQELGGASVHTAQSGVADHLAVNEEHALSTVRKIVKQLNFKPPNSSTSEEYKWEEPKRMLTASTGLDPYDIIEGLVDGGDYNEFKKEYGKTLVCATAKLYGNPVGIIANNGILFSESSLKGCHFIQNCAQRNIPLLFLQNITGFIVGKKYEAGGIAKNGAKLVNAVATANVPKLTLITGGSYGAGNYGMCGRAYSPRFLFMWPDSKIAVMGGEQAQHVLTNVGKTESDVKSNFERQSSAFYSTSNLWDDGIIKQEDTRFIIGCCLDIATRSMTFSDLTSFGVFRM